MLHNHVRVALALCAALGTMGVGRAMAQIGSGWTAYNLGKTLQLRGCGEHRSSAGVDTFHLTCSTSGGDQRSEQRISNYTSGTHQFQGEVRVVSLAGTNIALKQTFMPNNGPFLIIAVANNGRLYTVGDGAGSNLGTAARGRWVRINTIHDVNAGTIGIYVDGSLRYTKRGARRVAWHDKYGAYRTNSGRGTATVEWRNVRYFRGGRAGGSTQSLIAASAPPMAFEAENLLVSSSESAPLVPSDPSGGGGLSVALDATGPGSWMEFSFPPVPPGEYMLKLAYRPGTDRGQLLARVDGADEHAEIGGPVDQFGDDPSDATALLGNVTFTDASEHKVRLVAAGQNSSSRGFVLSADKFVLEPSVNGGDGGEIVTDGVDVSEIDDQATGFGCTVGGRADGGDWYLFGIGLLVALLRRRV